jgi:UDP-glucose 4-epimerase
MQKILVTGGTGYIGSHTVIALAEAGYIPVIVDNFSNSGPKVLDRIALIIAEKPLFYEGDCADASFLEGVFDAQEGIVGVIHFAAHKAVGESIQEPLRYYRNNLNSLATLLEIMRRKNVSSLVFSSSATVYGKPDENPISEEAKIKESESPYGNTKIIGEQIIKDQVKSGVNLSALALRYFNPVGAHPSGKIGELPIGVPNNLLPFLTQVAAGRREKLTVYGGDYDTPDGTCIRDYIHVVDLARAHIAALEYLEKRSSPYYDVFNVGTGNGNSVLELINEFERVNGVKLNYEIGPRREGDISVCYADVAKINKVLGWKAELDLEDALRDSWHWEQSLKTEDES